MLATNCACGVWSHRLQGVLYGLTRKGRVLIADEMGVGKTVQALALAACYQVSTLRPHMAPAPAVICDQAAVYKGHKLTKTKMLTMSSTAH